MLKLSMHEAVSVGLSVHSECWEFNSNPIYLHVNLESNFITDFLKNNSS
jgi:hypothetical protein